MPITLTKTQLLNSRQCAKRLWLEVHSPQLAELEASSQSIIADGHAVGELARRVLAADGELLAGPMEQALARTADLLGGTEDTVLHEATFRAQGLLIRADLLWRRKGRIEVAEVKSSSKLKPHYIDDCAIQYWVMREAGYTPASFALCHVNSGFLYQGGDSPSDYAGLFTLLDISDDIEDAVAKVPQQLEHAQQLISAEQPEVDTGAHCSKPNPCPFIAHCQASSKEPVAFPLARYPGLKRETRARWTSAGYKDIRDVTDDAARQAAELRSGLEQQRWQVASQGREWRSAELAGILQALPYPRYYLDFESISFTIPRWPGTTPFEHIPFQWSVHIEQADGYVGHAEFLDLSGELPMRALAEQLLHTLRSEGPILVFTSYEKTRIRALAQALPDLADALHALEPRLYDLFPLLRRHYYHPQQNGSFSIKAILPCVVHGEEVNYKALDGVKDGLGAQLAYLEAIDPDTDAQHRQQLRAQLLAYCKLDTLAPLEIVRELSQQASH